MDKMKDDNLVFGDELGKAKLKTALVGCCFKKCLSSDCVNFIKKSSIAQDKLLSTEERLVSYFKLLKTFQLNISCYEDNKDRYPVPEKYADLINFSFNKMINLSPEEIKETFTRLELVIENIIQAPDQERIDTITVFENKLSSEFLSLELLLDEVLPHEVSLIILQFLPLFHFFVDIEVFYNLKYFQSFFKKLSYNVVLSEEVTIRLNDLIPIRKSFSKFIENLQNILTIKILECPNYLGNAQYKASFKELCEAFKFFNKLNQKLPAASKILEKDFANESIMSETDIKSALLLLLQGSLPRRIEMRVAELKAVHGYLDDFNFIDYPFLFLTVDKIEVLKFESYFQQDSEIENAILNRSPDTNILFLRDEIYLELVLRRDHLLEDSLNQLGLDSNFKKLKRQLHVHFVGEPGIDEGGLTKEFFQLITMQLFDPSFVMFEEKNNRFLWFDLRSFECNVNFQLVGILLGLALFNQVIIQLPLPVVLYKKLVIVNGSQEFCDQITLEDLAEIEPETYTFLKNTLKQDFELVTHELFFAVEKDFFGETRTFELIANGSQIAVTNANKKLFVEKYLDWYFNISVQKHFDAFCKGFFAVISGKVIKMFRHVDLFLALNGNENLDFEELRRTTEYDQGFTEDSETISIFWKIIFEFSDQQKRDFLKFLTGSPRAPLKGLSELKMTISRSGDDVERLPASHTCFNHLLLPEYKTEEKLREKMIKAIEYAEGFGLI